MSGAARAPGRPTTGTKVQVRIPAELLERIDQLAAEYEVSRAEFIRRTLADGASSLPRGRGTDRQPVGAISTGFGKWDLTRRRRTTDR